MTQRWQLFSALDWCGSQSKSWDDCPCPGSRCSPAWTGAGLNPSSPRFLHSLPYIASAAPAAAVAPIAPTAFTASTVPAVSTVSAVSVVSAAICQAHQEIRQSHAPLPLPHIPA